MRETAIFSLDPWKIPSFVGHGIVFCTISSTRHFRAHLLFGCEHRHISIGYRRTQENLNTTGIINSACHIWQGYSSVAPDWGDPLLMSISSNTCHNVRTSTSDGCHPYFLFCLGFSSLMRSHGAMWFANVGMMAWPRNCFHSSINMKPIFAH